MDVADEGEHSDDSDDDSDDEYQEDNRGRQRAGTITRYDP